MMTSLAALLVAGACWLEAGAIRSTDVEFHELIVNQVAEASTLASQKTTSHCCCRAGKCEAPFEGKVYSPNDDVCCQSQGHQCKAWWELLSRKFTKTPEYCQAPVDRAYEPPPTNAPPSGEPVNYTEGTPGHTVQNYCDFSRHVDDGDGNAGDEQRHALIRGIVEALEKSDLDAMAKEIFSVYMCVRWAPSPEFHLAAQDEINNEQIAADKSVLEHYEDFSFMPMRCSHNYHVYGDLERLNETHYQHFEAAMLAQVDWYRHEGNGVLRHRLHVINEKRKRGRKAEVEELTRAFDKVLVADAASKCTGTPADRPIAIDMKHATAAALMADCAAVLWWKTKLADWQLSMPFTTFITPKGDTRNLQPAVDEQMLVCFGKRVASDLHRRKNGGHLITDQSAIGCHGFWNFAEGANMLERIVKLWKPPTCQLAHLELSLKVKILEVMGRMNDQLFDALPSILVEEMAGIEDWDGKQLDRQSTTTGILAKAWSGIVSFFDSFRKKYDRLGKLLSGTPVKWVVCPLKQINSTDELQKLDAALGSEDFVTRWYSRIAYSKYTGEKVFMPGEKCEETEQGLSRSLRCSLGQMRESMPEPYGNEEFVCPEVPLLPAKSQLEIFSGKKDQCFLHMKEHQIRAKDDWYFRGHTPTRKQYNVTTNHATDRYQAMKPLSFSTWPDAHFKIDRDWVLVAYGCTEEEYRVTPRWCSAPVVLNPRGSKNLLTGDWEVPPLQTSGYSDDKESWSEWFDRLLKKAETSVRRFSNEWAGRANTRYHALRAKLFGEVEAADLLHAASFQRELPDAGGDSKSTRRFDRYAVAVPCVNFDPTMEFDLKYKWSERALQLARKGQQDFSATNWGGKGSWFGFFRSGAINLAESPAYTVEVRGSAVLHMSDASNAWVTFFTHLRAQAVGAPKVPWRATRNPLVQELAGSLNLRSNAFLTTTAVRGFKVTIACGTRREMHALALDPLPTDPNLKRPFKTCVMDGIVSNDALRAANPGEPFLADEIVVRVNYAELADCQSHLDSSLHQTANETENQVYKNFLTAVEEGNCRGLDVELPGNLASQQKAGTYRGMYQGKGAPQNTLREVLLDPKDVNDELAR
jgi:hypothetical protein